MEYDDVMGELIQLAHKAANVAAEEDGLPERALRFIAADIQSIYDCGMTVKEFKDLKDLKDLKALYDGEKLAGLINGQ